MQERFETVKTQMIQYTKVETFLRKIPTVFGIRMKRITNRVEDDEVTIVSGIGKNAAGFDLPYNESQSGNTMNNFS